MTDVEVRIFSTSLILTSSAVLSWQFMLRMVQSASQFSSAPCAIRYGRKVHVNFPVYNTHALTQFLIVCPSLISAEWGASIDDDFHPWVNGQDRDVYCMLVIILYYPVLSAC
ncbi:uncharacterized protein EV420DRAFT_1548399 [Desarmillaria tabescens]|uniref:Uncharacterized protein n=1 Tax=Armillaria tabescens TaxID=1929756 RepID=A0AA39KAA2_ARMTA|nr:uncharacterized protein EV420DRAFT_1548399 [Desarmillaria tabescens]KAK0457469.1 hypothetical protein EV420DRAFT_1548399 [Desarmillaria tabescens]